MKEGISLLLLLALVACSSAPVGEPPAPLPEFKAAFEVKEAWSVDVGEATKDFLGLVPRVNDGVIYAAGASGRVSALNAETGRQIWEVELQTRIGGAAGVGAELVAVGTRDGQVIALARDTGARRWSAAVSSEVLAPPAIGEATVVVQTVDGRVFGLAAGDGKRLWTYQRTEPALSLRGTDSPVLVADAVLAGFASGKLVALSLKEGNPLWEATVSQPRGRNEIERLVDVDAAPLVFPDALYVASYQGKLVAINPRSGSVIWSRDVSTYTGLATDGNNIYVTDDNSRVLAFDRRSGASVWTQQALRGRRLSPPAVQGDFVVVADYEGYVHWLARDDGRFMARHQVGSNPVRAAAAVAGESLFVAATSGTVSALRLVQK